MNACFLVSAEVMFPTYIDTERQMQISYLSYFYFTQLLLDKLIDSGLLTLTWSGIATAYLLLCFSLGHVSTLQRNRG